MKELRKLATRVGRTIRGWLCFRFVMALPVLLDNPAYCWMLGWAGWYANGGDAPVSEEKSVQLGKGGRE